MAFKTLAAMSLAASLLSGVVPVLNPGTPANSSAVYRLYNTHTGEHFYTTDRSECTHLISVGWLYEGTGWQAYNTGDPVYRLYNPNANGGDHYYTVNKDEADNLVKLGWKWDNGGSPVFYSSGDLNLYVAYNPNAKSGTHNYTTSQTEQNHLASVGWKNEGVAWKVADLGIEEGNPGNRTVKVDENVTGAGGAEQNNPGSYRTLYSNKMFDYTDLDNETPVIAFSGDIAINGQGKSDYETQFVIAGNGSGSGQIGIELHYQAGNDALFKQGEINVTVINFPANAGTSGEQFYSVNTIAPRIVDNQFVHLTVQYYAKGYMAAFVNDQLVGLYKTQLTTPNAYILHNFCNAGVEFRNLKVEKNGVDVTNQGVPGFSATSGTASLVNGAY